MKIRELVRKTGVPKETIHYYIREGLLRRPKTSLTQQLPQVRATKANLSSRFLPYEQYAAFTHRYGAMLGQSNFVQPLLPRSSFAMHQVRGKPS